jgi:hypothetical protein
MDSLPKDVLSEMALNLSPPDLIKFCATAKRQNKSICESETFWRRKLERDYPEEFLEFYQKGVPVKNPKAVYIKRFTFFWKKIEEFAENFIDEVFTTGFKKFLTEEYRQELFKAIYDIFEVSKKMDEDGNIFDLIDDYMHNLYPETIDFGVVNPSLLIEKIINYLLKVDTLNEEKRKQANQYKNKKKN